MRALATLAAGAMILALVAAGLQACGPLSTPPPDRFGVVVEDVGGAGGALVVVIFPGTGSARSLVLPPGGRVLEPVAPEPGEVWIYGPDWPAGRAWTADAWRGFWVWHVRYPTAQAWGEYPR